MSHKILVSPKFISIGIVITKIVQSGNYPNSHKYTTVINIKVLSCGKKYWRFSFVLSPSVKSGKQKEIWGGKKRYLEKFEVLSLKFDIKKWYSLRSFSLIPLSKTHVDQNMKKRRNRESIYMRTGQADGTVLSPCDSTRSCQSATPPCSGSAKPRAAQKNSWLFAQRSSTGSDHGFSLRCSLLLL